MGQIIMTQTIGLTYDLRSDYLAEGFTEEQVAEFDMDVTVDALEAALRSLGYNTDRIGHARALCGRLVGGDRWDLVFNIAEGVNGRCREAQVPALLELYGIPYTCSDPLVCAATLDKAVAKRLVQAAGLNTPRFCVIGSQAELEADSLPLKLPVFAKPIAEGTGKGIDAASRIEDIATLRAACRQLLARYGQPVLIEEYLPGREFTTAIVGTGAAARVIGTMEIRIKDGAPAADYSYVIKEQCDQFVDYLPAPDEPLRADVDRLALAAYRALECRDVGRVDIRCDCDGRPAFIEINPLPGIHPHHSDLPMIAAQQGIGYVELIGAIVGSAFQRAGGNNGK